MSRVLKTSLQGQGLIKYYESLHDGDLKKVGLQPKMDASQIWTEGWGHAIVDPKTGQFVKGLNNMLKAYNLAKVFTVAEADALFIEDVYIREQKLLKLIKVNLTQTEWDAIMSFYYNAGYSETLIKLINTKNVKSTAQYHKDLQEFWYNNYVKSGGVWMLGLARRRTTECNLFTTGILKYVDIPGGTRKK